MYISIVLLSCFVKDQARCHTVLTFKNTRRTVFRDGQNGKFIFVSAHRRTSASSCAPQSTPGRSHPCAIWCFCSHVRRTSCDVHIIVPHKHYCCGYLNHTRIYVTCIGFAPLWKYLCWCNAQCLVRLTIAVTLWNAL